MQGNTLEQLMIFLPLLWLATHFFAGPAWLPAAIGAAFLVGRVMFMQAYMADPAKRLPGVVLGMLANLGLLILALIGLAGRFGGSSLTGIYRFARYTLYSKPERVHGAYPVGGRRRVAA